MSLGDPKFLNDDYYLKHKYNYFCEFQRRDLKYDRHYSAEIMGVVRGECLIPLKGGSLALKAGDIIFLDSQSAHGLLVDKASKIFCLQFELSKEKTPLKLSDMINSDEKFKMFIRNMHPYYVFRDHEDISLAMKQFCYAIDTGRNYYAYILMAEILLKVANIVCSNEQGIGGNGIFYINKAMDFISSNLHLGISPKEVAEYLNFNPSYFGRIFKKHVGITLVDYISESRVGRAKIYLTDTKISIGEICTLVGFSTRQYFTNVFTKYEGVSPQKYRLLKTMKESYPEP